MSEAKVRFTADTRNFQNGVRNMSQSMVSLRSVVAGVGTALAAIGAANAIRGIANFGINAVTSSSKAAASFETLQIQFQTLIGDVETANGLLKEMQKYGATTPLQLKDIQQATKTLLAFGVEVEDIMPTLRMLGDVSMGDAQKLQSLSRAFGKISSAGKATMEDINIMVDAGFNPLSEIAKKTGEEMSDLRDRVSDGNVSLADITGAFTSATSVGGRFNDMLKKISGTTEGKLSNLADAIDKLKIAFGTGLNVGLSDILDKLNQLVPSFETQVTKMGEAAGELLRAFATHLPDTMKQITDAIEKEGGITNALIKAVKDVLNDPSIGQALKDLIANSIPKSVRESTLGTATSTFIKAFDTPLLKEALAVGLAMRFGGKMMKAGATGAATAGGATSLAVGSKVAKSGTSLATGAATAMVITGAKDSGALNSLMPLLAGMLLPKLLRSVLPKLAAALLVPIQKIMPQVGTKLATKVGGAMGAVLFASSTWLPLAIMLTTWAVNNVRNTLEKTKERIAQRQRELDAGYYIGPEVRRSINERIQRDNEMRRRIRDRRLNPPREIAEPKMMQDKVAKLREQFLKDDPAMSWTAANLKAKEEVANEPMLQYEREHMKAVMEGVMKGFKVAAEDALEVEKWTKEKKDLRGIPFFSQFEEIVDLKNEGKLQPTPIEGFGLGRMNNMLSSLAKLGGGAAFAGSNNLTALQTVANGYLSQIAKNTSTRNRPSGNTVVPVWG